MAGWCDHHKESQETLQDTSDSHQGTERLLQAAEAPQPGYGGVPCGKNNKPQDETAWEQRRENTAASSALRNQSPSCFRKENVRAALQLLTPRKGKKNGLECVIHLRSRRKKSLVS